VPARRDDEADQTDDAKHPAQVHPPHNNYGAFRRRAVNTFTTRQPKATRCRAGQAGWGTTSPQPAPRPPGCQMHAWLFSLLATSSKCYVTGQKVILELAPQIEK
jgi:hypothetical protein